MNEAPEIFLSPTYGRTVFHESPKDWSPIKTCAHCILARTKEDCDRARCSPETRSDGRDGYYTVQDMPNQEKS
jgi:hypothetical protein